MEKKLLTEDSVKILLVDDEPDILRYLKRALSNRGYDVQPVQRAEAALDLLKESHFDLLLTDLKMPEMDGLSLLRKAKESLPALEVVMMTGFASVETAVGSMKLGAFDYLVKPFNMEEIFTVIQRAIRHLETKNGVSRFRELDHMKEDFLSTVSHELRTPLTSIKSATGILMEEFNDVHREADRNLVLKFVSIIDRSSGKMIRMVEDLLETFRFHTGKISLKKIPFTMERLIAECVEEFVGPCQERGLTLISDIEPDIRDMVGDPVKLRQVLLNLLGNAMKFTPAKGRIVMGARMVGDVALEIFVSDTGVGIPPEQHQKVFQKFYQVDGTSARMKPGLGLGLTLVKAIVDSHHGTISLISLPGKGSTFTIRLPITPKDGSAVPNPIGADLPSLASGENVKTGESVCSQ